MVTLPTDDPNDPGALWSGLPDGSGGTQLSSDGGGLYCCPSYSASGERIVFAREFRTGAGDYELWMMNADGSGERQLTSLGGSAFPGSFSSSEPRVAFGFASVDGNSADIYTVRLDGSRLRRLTATPSWHDADPVYSLGGHRLIWYRDPINFKVTCKSRDSCGQLWTMRSDGTHKRLLAEVVSDGGGGDDLDWGPGGDRIAYLHGTPNGSILSIFRTDGTRVRNIPRPRAGGIAWSPDGRWIAYTYFSRATGSGVRVVSVDGTRTRDIPNFWGDAEFLGSGLGWQPNPT